MASHLNNLISFIQIQHQHRHCMSHAGIYCVLIVYARQNFLTYQLQVPDEHMHTRTRTYTWWHFVGSRAQRIDIAPDSKRVKHESAVHQSPDGTVKVSRAELEKLKREVG